MIEAGKTIMIHVVNRNTYRGFIAMFRGPKAGVLSR